MNGIKAEDLIRAAAECVTCGKEHERRKVCVALGGGWVTWASPDDGHVYRPRLGGDHLDALRALHAEMAATSGVGR